MKHRLWILSLLVVTGSQAINAQVTHPPETRNAALRYWVAFAEMVDPPADAAKQDVLEKTAAGVVPWDERRLGPVLDANADAIQTLQRATKLPECDWGFEYSRGARASVAYVARARVLARLNTLQAIRQWANSDSDSAVNTIQAGIRFSQHLAKGGTLIFALVAKSALLSNLQALARAVKQSRLSGPQKMQVSSQLKTLPEDGLDWATAWALEELPLLRLFEELKAAKDPGMLYREVVGQPLPNGLNVPTASELVMFRDYMAGVRDALKLEPGIAKGRLAALDAQKRSLPEMARQLIPNAEKVNEARLEVFSGTKELLNLLGSN